MNQPLLHNMDKKNIYMNSGDNITQNVITPRSLNITNENKDSEVGNVGFKEMGLVTSMLANKYIYWTLSGSVT